MKTRKIALMMISALVGAFTMGCEPTAGDTGIPLSTAKAAAPMTQTSSILTQPDPEAKAKREATEAEEQVKKNKPGAASDTAAPGATPPAKGEKVAVIDTNLGQIILKFFPKKAPGHVKNFTTLANKGFYDGTKFHRVIPGFMIQGGDPYSKNGRGPVGTGGPGYQIKAEFNDTHHARGILSMARSQDKDSAGSQFFICVDDASSLDNNYTAFGQVVKGMDVVDKIVNLPRDPSDRPTPDEAVMKKVRVVSWPIKK